MRLITRLLALLALMSAAVATAAPPPPPASPGLALQAKAAVAAVASTATAASTAAAAAAASAATNASAISVMSGSVNTNTTGLAAANATIANINNTLTSGSRTKIEFLQAACQSTEHGQVLQADAAAYPQAFGSLRNPSVYAPLSPAVSTFGGWQYAFYDVDWDYGYDVTIINGCIGSASMLTDFAGFVKFRTPAAQYNGARASRGGIDRGYVGDVISPDGVSYWLCTTGNNRYALNSGPRTIGDVGFGSAFADFASGFGAVTPGQSPALVNLSTAGTIYTANTTMGSNSLVVTAISVTTPNGTVHAYSSGVGGATGQPVTSSGLPSGTKIISGPANGLPGTYVMNQVATATANGITVTETAPTFPTSPTGVQVLDGSIVWTLLQASTAPPYANSGTVLTETQAGIGFDPHGVLQRNNEAGLAVRNVAARYAFLQNGQGDLGTGATLYQAALTSVANFYLARHYLVVIGFTGYSPGSVGTIAQWQQIETGRNQAIAALQAANPGKVFAGADLFALEGYTGPLVGGARITGSISGSVLTVSAVAGGTVEVGQNVWSGQTLVGNVASLGTGTGGTGTYNLSSAVTASGTLVVAGTYFNYDGVHKNGAGAIVDGGLEAAAFKTILGKPGFGPISLGSDLPRAANDAADGKLAA